MTGRELFQIGLYHTYYQRGVSQQLALIPDTDTSAFFKRYGLLFHCVDSIHTVSYFGSNSIDNFKQNLRNLLPDNTPLNFILTNQDSDFYLVTDFPVDWLGDVTFSSQRTEANSEKSLKLMPLLGPRQLVKTSQVGQVSIYPESLYNNNDYIGGAYKVEFNARHTHWNYIVFNRSAIKLSNAMIKNRAGIVFSKPYTVKAKNQEDALLFSSGENTFAMKEHCEYGFSLINQESSKNSNTSTVVEKVLISDLPTPSPTQINIEVEDEKSRVYSQAYIYL
jgi:hypothetical protein